MIDVIRVQAQRRLGASLLQNIDKQTSLTWGHIAPFSTAKAHRDGVDASG